MKFLTGIKLGAAIYIGWQIAKGIDEALDRLIGKQTYNKLNAINLKLRKKAEKPKKERDYTIGFRMDT